MDEISRPVSPHGGKKQKRKHKKKANKHNTSFAVSELVEENKTAQGPGLLNISQFSVVPRESFDVVPK